MDICDNESAMQLKTKQKFAIQKQKFSFSNNNDGLLLNIHHTISQNGKILRIRFTNVCFSHENEYLTAVDHRGNLFVFHLAETKYWLLHQRFKDITAVECVPGTTDIVLGNKEGYLFVINYDTGSELIRIKAHSTCIERISFSIQRAVHYQQHLKEQRKSQPSISVQSIGKQKLKKAKSSTNATLLFLVATSQCAKLYEMRNFVEVHQLNYGATDALERIVQIQWVPKSDLIVGCGMGGKLRVWKSDFTLVKQMDLRKMKDNYLKKHKINFIDSDIYGKNVYDSEINSNNEINRVIKTITSDKHSKGYVKSAQFTKNGRFILLNCVDNTLIVVSSDVWQICKVFAYSSLFITQFEIIHMEQYSVSQTSFCVVAKTVESDLLLMNLEDGSRSYIAHSSENKCYKFRLSSNGKMLAQVLKSGEIFLHSMECHSCVANVNKLHHLTTKETGKTHSRPTSTASRTLSTQLLTGEILSKDNFTTLSPTTSSYTPPLTVASSTSGTTGPSWSIYRRNSKIKFARRLGEIHDKISKTLGKNRLLPILKEFGEYPEKHRNTIWRTLLVLPQNIDCFNALVLQGHHSCVADYDHKFARLGVRTVRNLKKIVSCLAYWSAVFAQCDFIPYFVWPFARMYQSDSLSCFEIVATILLNHCQLWFEFAPLEPFNYLGMIENILCEYEPMLMNFYRDRNISSRVYALTMMETAFAENFDANQWQLLWDHLLSNESFFMIFFVVAYNASHRTTIMNCATEKDIGAFFHEPALIAINRLLKSSYNLMEQCAESVHPKYYMKSFVPLSSATQLDKNINLDGRNKSSYQYYELNQLGNRDEKLARSTYSKFSNFPRHLIDVKAGEVTDLKAQQQRLETKIVEMEKLEHLLKARMRDSLVEEEHEKRMKEVERKFEKAIADEEKRIELQRKLLLLHKKQLREQEKEMLLETRHAMLRKSAAARESELEALLRTIERGKRYDDTDLLFAQEGIKLQEMDLLSRKFEMNVKSMDDRPLEQRYQQAIQQLERRKQILYEDIGQASNCESNRYTINHVNESPSASSFASEMNSSSNLTSMQHYEKKIKDLESQLETLLRVTERDET
ncbi:TBC1 domain family member 31 [Toxorhynchites rutilus septentrionalis]|uniref:TBC1 domain family member 31 n=1 Tax=Toxorhynchites rutilus septentrionalis TaxID=329112 RepID=UPI0024793F59|nr:TBC1 domain family member 31 [Toxorhynchites rutilus septentrionalis]